MLCAWAEMLQGVCDNIVEDLIALAEGVQCVVNGREITVKAHLISILGDYRALPKMASQRMAPTGQSCPVDFCLEHPTRPRQETRSKNNSRHC